MTDQPVILITGASSGIGAATARLFARNDYRVVLAARRLERLQTLADEIRAAGGQALPIAADMQQHEQIEALAQAALEAFGQIDILFNNAGFGRLNWLENLQPQADIEALIQVNVTGVIEMARAVLPHMIARRRGHIINMASMAALIATPTYSVYAASKFAVRGFSEALRREVGLYNVRVSLVCPGGVATEFGEIAGYERTTKITTPKPLLLSAEDVAQAVLRLARRPRRLVVLPGIMRWAVLGNALFPGLLDWVMQRLFVAPERAH